MSKWIYLIILLLLVLLLGLWSNAWSVGSINERQDRQLEQKQEMIDKAKEKIKTQDKKIKQLKKQLQSKRKQNLAKKAPQAPVVPTKRVSNPNQREILAMVYNTFWPDPRFATLIACESGFNPTAVGYDASHNQYNYGLFQVSQFHGWSYNYLIQPKNNIKAARIIYDRQGFYAWPTCARRAGLIA